MSGRCDKKMEKGMMEKALDAVMEFFGSWRFAAFAISLILFFDILIITVLWFPWSGNSMSSFVEAFKVWCFGYDPESKSMSWSYVATFYLVSAMLSGVILAIWGGALSSVLRNRPRSLLPWSGSAMAVVTFAGIAFAGMYEAPSSGIRPFPVEGLRTAYKLPGFSLTNQSGRGVSPEQLKNRVALVTAVYSTCGETCPLILDQINRVTTTLTDEERRDLTVLVITLDPENDTPEVLGHMAKVHGVRDPFFNFLSGEPAAVNGVLDRLGFARQRDQQTGIIDHANLFLLVDRQGRIAYRFTLGDEQEAWLTQTLRLLIKETL